MTCRDILWYIVLFVEKEEFYFIKENEIKI